MTYANNLFLEIWVYFVTEKHLIDSSPPFLNTEHMDNQIPQQLPQPTQQTKSTSLLYHSLFLFISAIVIYVLGFFSGIMLVDRNEMSASKISESTPFISPTPVNNDLPFPKTISEKKNIKVGKRSAELGIRFADNEKITYDLTDFLYQQIQYPFFDFHLPEKDIRGAGQKLQSDFYGDYLQFIYEGFQLKPLEMLSKKLEQSDGYYPATIYDETDYDIFTNKNGVKMKRAYLHLPGYVMYQIEFLISSKADSKYPYRYYTFSTSVSTLEKYNFKNISSNPTWVKQHQIPEFIQLDKFIETISL